MRGYSDLAPGLYTCILRFYYHSSQTSLLVYIYLKSQVRVHRTNGPLVKIYGHGGHLGHVTSTIYTNFSSPFLRMLHMKFGINWTRGFREEDL